MFEKKRNMHFQHKEQKTKQKKERNTTDICGSLKLAASAPAPLRSFLCSRKLKLFIIHFNIHMPPAFLAAYLMTVCVRVCVDAARGVGCTSCSVCICQKKRCVFFHKARAADGDNTHTSTISLLRLRKQFL